MRTYKTVAIPARSEERLDKIACDLCGEVIRPHDNEVDLAILKREIGSRYADGGYGTGKVYDLCGDCFDRHVAPFLASLGMVPITEEWDY